MPLTELQVRNAKPIERPFKLADGGGLHLLVQPKGGKLWRLKYRFAGREKLLSFGPYPTIGLALARTKRDDAKRLLAAGIDPSAQRKIERIAAATANRNTFGALASEYLERKKAEGAAQATLTKLEWLLTDLAAPIAARPITEIQSIELRDLLDRVQKSGRGETARRLRGTISSVYRFAIANLRAQNDPTYALRGMLPAHRVTHRAAIIDEGKLGGLMRSIDGYDGWATIAAALKILALTCTRPGEVRLAKRSEFDLSDAIWRIPPERMKMKQPHDVPLSQQAIVVLRDVWPLSEGGEFVFPSVSSSRKPLSENTLNAALRRMGYAKDEMTAHGFRSSASTILNSRGFDPDVIEAVLAHQDPNAVRRAYNRSRYWPERKRLLQDWADLLDAFRLGGARFSPTVDGIKRSVSKTEDREREPV